MTKFTQIRLPDATTVHIPTHLVDKGYTVDEKGVGSESGIVWKFNSPNRDVQSIVIKKFIHPFTDKDRALRNHRELNLLRALRHPNVVRLVGQYAINEETGDEATTPRQMSAIYHITYHCGEPLSTVIGIGNYGMDRVKRWTRDALSGLQYIHSLGIFHRDLSPANICISKPNEQLALLGFSKARKVEGSNAITARRGDNFYMAIEMQVDMKKAYDEKVDIWSLAVVLCEMITGSMLFGGRNGKEVKNVIRPMLEYCGPVDEEVIEMMLNQVDRDGIRAASAKAQRVPDFREHLRGMVGVNRDISPKDIDNEPDLPSFIERTLQHNPRARMAAEVALVHPFVDSNVVLKDRRHSLPGADDAAIDVLRNHIWHEIHEIAMA